MAGINREQVSRALHLAEVFAEMQNLMELLVNGTVSVNKLRRVVSIATIENEKKLANLVQTLSKSSLETFVRDILIERAREEESRATMSISAGISSENKINNGLFEPLNACNSGLEPKVENVSNQPLNNEAKKKLNELAIKPPDLSDEVKQKLNELQEKKIDINEIILTALAQREAEIAQEKDTLAEKAEQKLIEQIVEEKIISRVAPVATKRLLKKEFGTRCSKPFCNKPSKVIHHTNRFALSQIHDPHFMAPLCREHHQIAHLIDVKVAEKRLVAMLRNR